MTTRDDRTPRRTPDGTPRPVPRLLDALHRFNAAHPWDHNARYHSWLLRQLPRRFGSALDVGCGSGDLVRLLARRARAVRGVDADADIVALARESTPAAAPVAYTVADASRGLPAGPYDVITCVAVLHHLPFAETLARFRRELAPGGTLAVVGCARASGAVDQVLGLTAVALNPLLGWVKNRGRAAPRPPPAHYAPPPPPRRRGGFTSPPTPPRPPPHPTAPGPA
ncbi:class I SAM-dependent methyltransferase, partial [Streptomyces tricolor]